MAYGLKVWDESGREQINSDKMAFALGVVRRETVSATGVMPNVNPGAVRYIDIAHQGECPLLALSVPPPLSAAVLASVRTGSSWTFRVAICAATQTDSPGNVLAPFTYYLFDRVKPVAASYGLNVWGPDGSLVFSSATKTLEVIAGPSVATGVTSLAFISTGYLYTKAETFYDEGLGYTYTDWQLLLVGATRVDDRIEVVERVVAGDRVEGGSGGPVPGAGLDGFGAASDVLVINTAFY